MTTQKVLTAAMILIALAIGYLLGLATPEGAIPEPWLFRWQTLVAGVLAIGAAAITVFEMQRTDERQQRRHDDLVSLSLRSDRLSAQRAAAPLARHIRVNAVEILRRCEAIKETIDIENFKENYLEINSLGRTLKLISEDDQFQESKGLFGPDMYHNFRAIRSNSKHVEEIIGKINLDYIGHASPAIRDLELQKMRLILSEFEQAAPRLHRFADDLEALARQYELA